MYDWLYFSLHVNQMKLSLSYRLPCRFFTINHPNVQCSNACKCSWGAITGAMTARAAVLWARGPCFTWWSAQHQHESGSFRTSKSCCLGICTDLSMGNSTGDTRQVKGVWLELTLSLLIALSDCPVWGNLGEVCSQLIWVMTWLLWPLLPGAKDVQSGCSSLSSLQPKPGISHLLMCGQEFESLSENLFVHLVKLKIW